MRTPRCPRSLAFRSLRSKKDRSPSPRSVLCALVSRGQTTYATLRWKDFTKPPTCTSPRSDRAAVCRLHLVLPESAADVLARRGNLTSRSVKWPENYGCGVDCRPISAEPLQPRFHDQPYLPAVATLGGDDRWRSESRATARHRAPAWCRVSC